MGRYYSGDIDGKFWFAVQSSDASERFGGQGSEPAYTEYYFQEEDLEGVELEIKAIKKKLGKIKGYFDEFFGTEDGYTDGMLREYLASKGEKLTNDEVSGHLSDYADLGLGIQIRDCIKENGSCSFQAEH